MTPIGLIYVQRAGKTFLGSVWEGFLLLAHGDEAKKDEAKNGLSRK